MLRGNKTYRAIKFQNGIFLRMNKIETRALEAHRIFGNFRHQRNAGIISPFYPITKGLDYLENTQRCATPRNSDH